MSKYTKGPWEAAKSKDLNTRIYAGDETVCVMGKGTDEDREDYKNYKANSQLIAAAPELLEALEALVPYFDFIDREHDAPDMPVSIEAIQRAELVIKKAKGNAD